MNNMGTIFGERVLVLLLGLEHPNGRSFDLKKMKLERWAGRMDHCGFQGIAEYSQCTVIMHLWTLVHR